VTWGSGGRAWIALGIALSAAFAVLAHAALVEGVSPAVGAFVAALPLAVVVLLAARRSPNRAASWLAVAAAGAVLWYGWGGLERNFPHLLFLEHAATNLTLAVLFGRTLLPGHEPLATTFARLVHGELPPEVLRYSRQVTVAWTLFFVAMLAASCGLYLAGARAAWSVFANFATPVGLAAMFTVEYAVRHRVLPHWERVGILGGVRAFSRHFGQARP
jgi:uncharacterized membrane protein